MSPSASAENAADGPCFGRLSGNGVVVVSGVFSLPLDPYCATESVASASAGSRLREFVFGAENRLLEVLSPRDDRPVPAWSVLVLCGPSQAGKTHVALGIAQQHEQKSGARRSVYVTGADFARQYATAVDTDDISEFRARFRRAGLVVIDDLALLAGKTSAQEELARTLDVLEARGIQTIVTWRAARFDPGALEPALASRLRGALVLPLQLPERSTRREIVRKLASARGLELGEPVLEGLAGNSPATFPELAARLAKVEMLGGLPESVNAELMMSELAMAEAAARPLEIKTIIAAVARHFQLRQADLRGSSRSRSLALARGVALHLARKLTGLSLSKIGKEFGGRDHTTVLHACVRLESLLESDAALRAEVEELRLALEHRSSIAKGGAVEKRSTRRRQRSPGG